jgi:hypothetical protein
MVKIMKRQMTNEESNQVEKKKEEDGKKDVKDVFDD